MIGERPKPEMFRLGICTVFQAAHLFAAVAGSTEELSESGKLEEELLKAKADTEVLQTELAVSRSAKEGADDELRRLTNQVEELKSRLSRKEFERNHEMTRILSCLRSQHATEVANLRTQHTAKVANLRAKHAAEVADLLAQHSNEVAELKAAYD